jgi:predicted nuclease with TOPRIM domain
MTEQIKTRIESLRAEYRTGQEMLAELEGRQAGLKMTLTRISGAIQVLEELLQENTPAAETTEIAANAERKAAA